MTPRVSELVALGYFVYLAALAWTRPLPRPALTRAACAAAAAGVVPIAAATGNWPLLRDWLPAAYLLVGYWLSGLFFAGPMPAVEDALARFDCLLAARARLGRLVGRASLEYLELAYLLCYPLVPAGFLTLLVLDRRDLADRYWTIVLAAELTCYAALPWVQTRPPRTLEPDAAIDRRGLVVRRVNLAILRRGSIQANTLPSGHAAGGLAIALAIAGASPAAGLGFLAIALSIAVASVVGRYHYAVDSLAGLLVALVAWAVVQVCWSA